jgi:hypothetical protein
LEERCLYTAEVAGSIPVPPTIFFGIFVSVSDILVNSTLLQILHRKSDGLLAQGQQIFGAVVQLGLGRQIVNLEVAGSNPVGPAKFSPPMCLPESETSLT